jgi:hypothetical protein
MICLRLGPPFKCIGSYRPELAFVVLGGSNHCSGCEAVALRLSALKWD